MPFRSRRLPLLVALLPLLFILPLSAQTASRSALHGQVADPSGAIIPGATITLSGNGQTRTAQSGGTGNYQFRGLPPGHYAINTTIEGFTPFTQPDVVLAPGQNRLLNISLALAVEQQQVQVTAESNTIDTTPDTNANAIVLQGKDLDALSDDPDELSNELQALAGPSAGPNGAQIYIDGFTGGQIPPKDSIREIRINQNPFAAQFDRLGYGRIEILTKAGSGSLHGHVFARGNDSAFNAQNPILNANRLPGQPLLQEPSYYSWMLNGNVGGPINKRSSFFTDLFGRRTENVGIVQAIDPASITPANPAGLPLNESVPNPSSRIDFEPRIDFQLGQSNNFTARYELYRQSFTNNGIGGLSLPQQGTDSHAQDNTLQISDDIVLGKNFVDSLRFQYRRSSDTVTPQFTTPSVNVQGSFVNGGNDSQTLQSHQDNFEFQDYFIGSHGSHALNFGGRLRAYHTSNYTDAGANGAYTFQSAAAYAARTPQRYQVTVVNNNQFTAVATPFDAALFYQDDWKVNRQLTLSYGLRWETQNEIDDKSDFGPRVYLAYALGHRRGRPSAGQYGGSASGGHDRPNSSGGSGHGGHGHGGPGQPKNVIRAGYGWFYERFTVPNGSGGTPYIINTLHHNLPAPGGVSNQQIYIVTNPPYTETSPGNAVPLPASDLTNATSAATYYTIAPNMHAALDMQGAIGLDHQIARNITSNITYLYSRGSHQFLTNNISAPFFSGVPNTYPATPLAPPAENIYQYQSGAVYREDQVIATINARLKNLSLFSFYTWSNAHSDSDSVNFFPLNAHDPGQDYGRAGFDVQNRFLFLASYTAPYAVTISPFFVYNSGTPYNITTGSDLTGNNQFNSRPTFANPGTGCTAPLVPFGHVCLNPDPVGTNEPIVPHNYGTGPSNWSVNLRLSKSIGFGPRLAGHGGGGGGGMHGHNQGLGGRGLSGNQAGPGRMDASVPRKYSLTFSAYVENLLNHQNLSPPNSTLSSPFFGRSQSLAGGFFSSGTAGNRSIFLQSSFSF